MYRYHTPSGDKSCDGLAMALRAGLPLRDMEMVQFHPTGLLAGTHTRMTGTVLEEGLRGAGGYLLNGAKERFMPRYDPKAERATRDSSRARCSRRCGRATSARTAASTSRWPPRRRHEVTKQFKGMVERCADCGFDLAGGLVEVVPTAHYMMGGVEFARRLHHRAAGPVRRRRGLGRRARRQPPRRQRRRQLDRVRRGRRRRDGRLGAAARRCASPTAAAIEAAIAVCERPFRSGPPVEPRAAAREALRRDVGKGRHPARRGRRCSRRRRAATRSTARSTRYALPTPSAPSTSPGTTGST